VTLAEELGYQLPVGVEAAGELFDVHLGVVPVPTLSSAGELCSFLGANGCMFPPDVMPVGCVSFLCPYMREWYSAEELGELRSGVDELHAAHRQLRSALLHGI
jgi:hypothetical protein